MSCPERLSSLLTQTKTLLSPLCCCTEVQSPPDCLVQAVLQALKVLVTCPLSRQEKSRGAWRLLLRSALSTLLGLWEPGRDPRHGREHAPTRRQAGS